MTNVKLRSPNFKSMEITLGATKVAGAMDKIQDVVGVYVSGGVSGDKDAFIYSAEKIVVPKHAATTVAFAKGDKVYFRSAGNVTNDPSGNTLCGRALETVAATATEVLIDLNGEAAA